MLILVHDTHYLFAETNYYYIDEYKPKVPSSCIHYWFFFATECQCPLSSIFMAVAQHSHALFASWPGLLLQIKV